jgi:hypothetical protein
VPEQQRSGVMRSAIRLCGGIAIVAFGLFAAIEAFGGGATPATSPADCGAGYCDVTAADLIALLFAFLGSLFATLTGLLVVVAGFLARRIAVGVGLALLIFTTLAVAIGYVVTNAFLDVLFYAPGAYFASVDQLPGYFVAGAIIFTIMLVLAPLPPLLFSLGSPKVRYSAPPGESGLRSPILPRLGLTSVLLAGVLLIVLDRMLDHYASAGVGPAWPLLVSAGGFYVFWLVAWLLLMGSLLSWRPASVS